MANTNRFLAFKFYFFPSQYLFHYWTYAKTKALEGGAPLKNIKPEK